MHYSGLEFHQFQSVAQSPEGNPDSSPPVQSPVQLTQVAERPWEIDMLFTGLEGLNARATVWDLDPAKRICLLLNLQLVEHKMPLPPPSQ